MTLIEKYKQLGLNLKYDIKLCLLSRAFYNLSDQERFDLEASAEAGVSYWENELSKYIENNQFGQTAYERETRVNTFGCYLMIDVLYDLLVKKLEFSDIKNPWLPKGNLMECVADSGVTPTFPVRTHMQVYKNKVILNNMTYYDSTLSYQTNKANQEVATNYVKVKGYEAMTVFMPNH